MTLEELRQKRQADSRLLRKIILENVDAVPNRLALFAAKQSGLEQQRCYREVQRMVTEGLLHADGNSHRRCYFITDKGRLALRKLNQNVRITRTPSGRDICMESDDTLINRKPKNVFEVERQSWLKRRAKHSHMGS